MYKIIAVMFCLNWPLAGMAQSSEIRLSAAEALVGSGFLDFLLPRFALKHGLHVRQVPSAKTAHAVLGPKGVPVFVGLGQVWHLAHDGSPQTAKFEAWLLSDIGRRTIEAYQIDGAAPFTDQIEPATPTLQTSFDGDPVAGERLALHHCGRCHVVNETNRTQGIGATPSFGMLRTLPDWENRVAGFYVLNPHPSFTQITGITPGFDPARPPPIVPLEISQSDLEAILAYVATIPLADLGAPIQSQSPLRLLR